MYRSHKILYYITKNVVPGVHAEAYRRSSPRRTNGGRLLRYFFFFFVFYTLSIKFNKEIDNKRKMKTSS